ncbi:MAG: RING-H2 finger protein [Chlamydiota bacterium]
MSVFFSNTKVYNPKDSCVICREFLGGAEVVAHNGTGGSKHPMHKACVRKWIKINPSCPFCRKSINARSLFSWKDKMVLAIKTNSDKFSAILIVGGGILASINSIKKNPGIIRAVVIRSPEEVVSGIIAAAIGGLATKGALESEASLVDGITFGSFMGIGVGVLANIMMGIVQTSIRGIVTVEAAKGLGPILGGLAGTVMGILISRIAARSHTLRGHL